jgi:hypothetical protein
MLQMKEGRRKILEKPADHSVGRGLICKKPKRDHAQSEHRCGTCGADVRLKGTALEKHSGLKANFPGADSRSKQAPATNGRRRFHGLEVLGSKTRFIPFHPDIEKADFPAHENGIRDSIPDNGSGPRLFAAVDLDHAHLPFTQTSTLSHDFLRLF